MDFDVFRERIRVAIIAGIFTVRQAVQYLSEHGWSTTLDVPENQREKMLEDLTK